MFKQNSSKFVIVDNCTSYLKVFVSLSYISKYVSCFVNPVKSGIVFVFKINDLSSLNISDEDVVVIMSNLLNNAIEACEKCRGDKIIKLKIVIEDNNAIISVKNTYENAVIYENGEIQTTKILDTDEHGIGIKNIAETIRKYGGSYVIQNDEREFYFSIMIPLVKSDF